MNNRRKHLPSWILAIAAAPALLFAAPLVALAAEVEWPALMALFTTAETLRALALSLECSLLSTVLCFAMGLPLATWLAQGSGALRSAVRVVTTLPMVLPPIVGGIALLLAFGPSGVVGGPLDSWFGVTVPFSSSAVVLATTYVSMPFFVLTVEGGMRSFDHRYTDAATTLGASPWRAFLTVTLPMIAPSLRAGLLVAWARALGEFGATITFAGSFDGRTRPLPRAVYHALESQPSSAVALSVVLLAISATILFLLRRQWFFGR
ncbi:MAG: molybdate ABC transporter permease subunit [Planctomycetota bacterium]|nr:molybdate ABC transporter permease subunit [Planctomycetota bacterium]